MLENRLNRWEGDLTPVVFPSLPSVEPSVSALSTISQHKSSYEEKSLGCIISDKHIPKAKLDLRKILICSDKINKPLGQSRFSCTLIILSSTIAYWHSKAIKPFHLLCRTSFCISRWLSRSFHRGCSLLTMFPLYSPHAKHNKQKVTTSHLIHWSSVRACPSTTNMDENRIVTVQNKSFKRRFTCSRWWWNTKTMLSSDFKIKEIKMHQSIIWYNKTRVLELFRAQIISWGRKRCKSFLPCF